MHEKELPATFGGDRKPTGTDAVLRAVTLVGESISLQMPSVTSPDQAGGNPVTRPIDTVTYCGDPDRVSEGFTIALDILDAYEGKPGYDPLLQPAPRVKDH